MFFTFCHFCYVKVDFHVILSKNMHLPGGLVVRNKLIFYIWFTRFIRYLLIPIVFCLVLIPLYSLMHQQTERAAIADSAEQLSMSANLFEEFISDLRFTTNKLFNSSSFTVLAASEDSALINEYTSLYSASILLQDLTYTLKYINYCYATFEHNHLVVDSYRFFRDYDTFYPNAIAYANTTQAQWNTFSSGCSQTTLLPIQTVTLNRTSYPDDYLTIIQPYINFSGQMRGKLTVLIQEDDLQKLFLPSKKWRENGFYFIALNDGSFISSDGYSGGIDISGNETKVQSYHGQKYLFVSRNIPTIQANVVIALPYSTYASSFEAVDTAILFYLGIGFFLCILLSAVMTLHEVHQLRPIFSLFKQDPTFNSRLLRDFIARKLTNHNQISQELEQTKHELDYSRVDALLRTGLLSESSKSQLTSLLQLTQYNYLLLIPSVSGSEQPELNQRLWVMMIQQQVVQCFHRTPFMYQTLNGGMLVVLSLNENTEEEQIELCRQSEHLHDLLELKQPLILSDCFTCIEEISGVYWQVRNIASYSDISQKVYYLNGEPLKKIRITDLNYLEQLNEYLLSACTAEAQALVDSMFYVEDFSAENFQQTFFSIRGILIGAAQKAGCADISHLCSFDRRLSAQQQVRNLKDCCFEICSHIDSLKRSHNETLQKKILNWLSENYTDPTLNLAMAADQFNISKKYVSQFLKDQTGKTFSEYLEHLRLSKALELLKQSNLGVTEISFACGFSAPNTFYKAFKRRYGISPSSVRND